MKKFFKFGCLGVIGLVVLIVIIGIVGSSGGDDKVSTGAKPATTDAKKETPKDDGSKKIDASKQQKEILGLKVGLGEIKIKKDKIQVGINLENTTKKKLSFYPDQGSAVIGDMQIDANLFLTDGKVGGDIQGGVKQDGVIEFLAPDNKEIDVKSVKEIKLIFGDVTTDDYMNSKEVEFAIPVK
ncbi:hypothetical protein [Neobacillus mesonae]|uniref:hypothetical protein n=1 Tax=Neobacillus mesonae TaxID=1193713 RepID=UPI002E1B4CED|nr:hypothetical protein [Neobacillus mesonae]